MVRKLFVRAFVLAGLVALGAGLCSLPAASAGDDPEAALETPSAYPYPWIGAYVDEYRAGTFLGVAVAPDTGEPYVSYYDWDTADLRFARYVHSGGNCGGGVWSCQLVDSAGDVGIYTSLAVFRDATGLHGAISYHDATTGSLKVATGLCGDTCTFETWLIDGGNPAGGAYTGRFTSVRR